jgi:hypothetical protein
MARKDEAGDRPPLTAEQAQELAVAARHLVGEVEVISERLRVVERRLGVAGPTASPRRPSCGR